VTSTKVTLVSVIAAAASYRRASGRWTNRPCAIVTSETPKALTSWTHTAMMCAALAAGWSARTNLGACYPTSPKMTVSAAYSANARGCKRPL